ncbi:hypothetical protein Anamo_1318 [Acetomicrobium mobile DSM 13181]|uniref:DUF5058 domain-containing protein n=1 Tax=Acetomicrobium mobile (strain ATCC BAA-54 / DSM 13181 / JCM 12221 / NGA) TaxID=891968 RepID=I4BXC0_ACEMN|nr:DUF5058 family protein [Acetomicrobium mobile]AFM21927.1 hypothetical protein Anamo_1318 [Acetomicrobium mobile DSM 13181]
MSEDVLLVANSLGVWITATPIVVLTIIQAYLYYKQIYRTADLVDLTHDQLKRAFRAGAVTAIGPSIAIFIIMVGLMSVIGAPMAWMRLAVIGAAPTELTAATVGADAVGVKFGGEGYDLYAMSVSWWTMAINGCGWLLFVGLFAHKLEGFREKMGAGDPVWLAILTSAAMIGVFGYLNGRNIITLNGPLTAALVGGVSMVILLNVAKKATWLKEYTLGIAMLIGMTVAAILF